MPLTKDFSISLQKDGVTPKVARARRRRKKLTAEDRNKKAVRVRDHLITGGNCRLCRTRLPQSVHEIVPKSLGGEASLENSIAVCGSGTVGCHGLLQRHEVDPVNDAVDANDLVPWVVKSKAAARWLGVPQRGIIVR